MSTEAQVNSAFPQYLNYYLHSNSVDDFEQYTLTYGNGSYTITAWNYQVTEPTMTDLQTYTLSDVETFAQAFEDRAYLASYGIPMVVTEAREIGLENLGGIPHGALVWCDTDNELHCWDGSQWKTVTLT